MIETASAICEGSDVAAGRGMIRYVYLSVSFLTATNPTDKPIQQYANVQVGYTLNILIKYAPGWSHEIIRRLKEA